MQSHIIIIALLLSNQWYPPLVAPKPPPDYGMIIVGDSYCNSCVLFKQAMSEDKMDFKYIQISDDPEVIDRMGIQVIPTFFMINKNTGNTLRVRPIGSRSKGECRLLLKKYFPEYVKQQTREVE